MFATNPKKFTRVVDPITASVFEQSTSGSNYDCGRFFVATQGAGAGTISLGHLWVEYEVELHTPQIDPTIAPTTGGITLYQSTGTVELNGTVAGVDTTAPFFGGTQTPMFDQNGLGVCTIGDAKGGYQLGGVTLPKGDWEITANVELCSEPTLADGTRSFLQNAIDLYVDGVKVQSAQNSTEGDSYKTTGLLTYTTLSHILSAATAVVVQAVIRYSYNSPNGQALASMFRSPGGQFFFRKLGAQPPLHEFGV
jgi:hypothetical protein